jgi:hypothetical protein
MSDGARGESAIARWGQNRGPCVGDFCKLEDATYRIGAIRDGIVQFEDRSVQSVSSNRFHMNWDGNVTFAGGLLASPTTQEASLVKLQGEKPPGSVVLPDSSQTRVGCRVFKAG